GCGEDKAYLGIAALRRALFGHFPGQLTIYSSSFSSGTSVSLAATRPRTDTPAPCTVSGSPDTSGCHQARSLPSATKRYAQVGGSHFSRRTLRGVSRTQSFPLAWR